ncbi:hypothetical protein HK100_012632 [Physocladia obscura]|uniref:Uncharacterized protein n=1 Tax=Physocladia obscura TaxID=109957 RepID=A0AAD5XFR5_9FUNG|nr:hypothetical protein HK100_012632 [Physocladia obscura]
MADCKALVTAFPDLLNYNITGTNCCTSPDPENVSQRVLCDGSSRIYHLDLAANGLEGPIPDFSALTELTEL